MINKPVTITYLSLFTLSESGSPTTTRYSSGAKITGSEWHEVSRDQLMDRYLFKRYYTTMKSSSLIKTVSVSTMGTSIQLKNTHIQMLHLFSDTVLKNLLNTKMERSMLRPIAFSILILNEWRPIHFKWIFR